MRKKLRRQMLEEIADRVKYEGWWPRTCQRIAEGATVSYICWEHALYIGAFREWVDTDPERVFQYRQALQARAARAKAQRAEDREMRKLARARVRAARLGGR
jgi:hypothetical protein